LPCCSFCLLFRQHALSLLLRHRHVPLHLLLLLLLLLQVAS
jgi:hypothetical protein